MCGQTVASYLLFLAFRLKSNNNSLSRDNLSPFFFFFFFFFFFINIFWSYLLYGCSLICT